MEIMYMDILKASTTNLGLSELAYNRPYSTLKYAWKREKGKEKWEGRMTKCYICTWLFYSMSFIFSSPKLKVIFKWAFLIVCRPSARQLFTFSFSSPEPLGQFQPNLAQSILGGVKEVPFFFFFFFQMKAHVLNNEIADIH